MMEDIDYKALCDQYQKENEELRRKALKRYFSATPVLDDIKAGVRRLKGWLSQPDMQILLVSALITLILSVVTERMHKGE